MRIIGSLLLLLVLIGCNSPRAEGPSKTQGKAGLVECNLDEVTRVVLADKDTWPVDVTDFHSDQDRIYLTDTAHSQQAFIYDKSGERVSLVGQPGQGPGEYQLPSGFCRSGDRLHLISGDRKYILYSLDGTYLKENLTTNPGGMGVRLYPGPDKTAFFVMYSRQLPKASLYQVSGEGELIRSFSPPDESFNLFWDMVNPMGTVVVQKDRILQVFSHRYEIKVFDLTGSQRETIMLSSNIYKQPDYNEVRQLPGERKAWRKFLKKYSLVNGLYQLGDGYATVLANTTLNDDREVVELWDSSFFGLGRYLIPESEKLVGTEGNHLVFYNGDSRTLIFRRLKLEKVGNPT